MEESSKYEYVQKMLDAFYSDKEEFLANWKSKEDVLKAFRVPSCVNVDWFNPPMPIPTKKNYGSVMGKFQGVSVLSEKDLQKIYLLKINDDRELTEATKCDVKKM